MKRLARIQASECLSGNRNCSIVFVRSDHRALYLVGRKEFFSSPIRADATLTRSKLERTSTAYQKLGSVRDGSCGSMVIRKKVLSAF